MIKSEWVHSYRGSMRSSPVLRMNALSKQNLLTRQRTRFWENSLQGEQLGPGGPGRERDCFGLRLGDEDDRYGG